MKPAAAEVWAEGVRLFETGDYWECHEVLEPLWLASSGLDKHFYGGVILLAAALHKTRIMGSARGGRRNYAKALAHLALLPDRYPLDHNQEVEIRRLEAAVHAALSEPSLRPSLLTGAEHA